MSASALEVYPELSVSPILPYRPKAQIARDIGSGPQMAVAGLKGHHAAHEEVRPDDVDFVADVGFRVVRL